MNFMHEQNKTPGSGRDFREFLFRLCKVAYTFQAANKVANNTYHNRNKKCDESFVHKTSPPFAWRVAAIVV